LSLGLRRKSGRGSKQGQKRRKFSAIHGVSFCHVSKGHSLIWSDNNLAYINLVCHQNSQQKQNWEGSHSEPVVKGHDLSRAAKAPKMAAGFSP
jgi:hypothetical protein